MANLLLFTRADENAARARASTGPTSPAAAETVLIASFGDAIAADYAEHVADGRVQTVDLTQPTAINEPRIVLDGATVGTCVLFLKTPLTEGERKALDELMPLLSQARFIGIVSTFQIYLGDKEAAAVEAYVVGRLRGLPARRIVLRTGYVCGGQSRAAQRLRRFGFAFPLVPKGWRYCFVDLNELCGVIDKERQCSSSRSVLTLLGPNRSWRDVLRENRSRGFWATLLTGVCFLLAILLVGQVARLCLAVVRRWRRLPRRWHVDTLRPRSFADLLALCNRHNMRHIKVVGYNNGVVHFGHRYPGKTVVSTVLCNRIVREGGDVIRADCGATVRDAMRFLAAADQELYVLPNYSYVCLGTAFFVPIHGSAVDYTTVAETIVKVLLYDPARDHFCTATRDEPAFRDHLYSASSNVVVLRLWIRVKPKSRYFLRREQWVDADGEQLLKALFNSRACNVEIRKAKAASRDVQVSTYFTAANEAGTLDFPRDSLGRLWDRLEENRLTSFLMHAATRYFAWHVELFLSAEQFVRFWQTHRALPLRKMQLRHIRRDGFPHSPFREGDCVSVDLFMLRWNRQRFETYLTQTFDVVRTNPGKHSQ